MSVRSSVSVSRRSLAGSFEARYGIDGEAGIGRGARGLTGTRAWMSTRLGFAAGLGSGALSVKVGAMVGDTLPQLMFRVGGPETVRGYTYGARIGRSVWAARIDMAPGQRRVISPVAFVDAGSTFTESDPLVGAGAGLSVLGGLMRLNLAKGLNPSTGIRFDLLFRAPR